MIHLGTIQLSSSTASVVFEAIPQNYQELIFIIEARSDGTDARGWNALSASPGPGAIQATTGNATRVTESGAGAVANSLTLAGTYALNVVTYPFYAVNRLKTSVSWFGQPRDAGSAVGIGWGVNSAVVNTITFSNVGGSNFVAGSRFGIYALSTT
jgi:hypothetical protein